MLPTPQVVNMQALAGELSRIVGTTTDYRIRVDAISEAIKTQDQETAKTALVIALASVSEQPLRNRG